jgi:hypothetical protein
VRAVGHRGIPTLIGPMFIGIGRKFSLRHAQLIEEVVDIAAPLSKLVRSSSRIPCVCSLIRSIYNAILSICLSSGNLWLSSPGLFPSIDLCWGLVA